MYNINLNENFSIFKNEDNSMIITGAWEAPVIDNPDNIPIGDMPGDQIKIGEEHIAKAQLIFPDLLKATIEVMNHQPNQKVIIAVHGGSGVGKSEIGALISYYFNAIGLGSYVLSGDNYSRRIPFYNDAERLWVFRMTALKALVSQGVYDEEKKVMLDGLIASGKDSDVSVIKEYPWMEIYQKAGRAGLSDYLGSPAEIDFQLINEVLAQFKSGKSDIMLKRMGRELNELWFEAVDFSALKVLVIEWTHGNNKNLEGVDFKVLLNSTPEETLAHRRLRNRDGALDSPFTTMVLSIEQKILHAQAKRANMIISKDNELLSYELYEKRMDLL